MLYVYDMPLGATEWRFVTTADGKTVAVTTPMAVAGGEKQTKIAETKEGL